MYLPENNTNISPEQSENLGNFFVRFGVPISILLGMSIIALSIYVSLGRSNGEPAGTANSLVAGEETARAEVFADDDPFLGNPDAPVTMVEFSDFQCPFCRKLWRDVLPQLKKEYIDTGQVKFVYRDFPLVSLHEMAQTSAEAAECAEDQGKFWEMHDKIFAEQDKLGQNTVSYTVMDIKKWAKQIGLNADQFNTCLDTDKYKSEVEKDQADGAAVGVSGTPATFINGQLVQGAQPFAVFKRAIEEALKRI